MKAKILFQKISMFAAARHVLQWVMYPVKIWAYQKWLKQKVCSISVKKRSFSYNLTEEYQDLVEEIKLIMLFC